MALIYSDIKSHFNMPDLTLDDLMEILFVTGRKKDRWEFAYPLDVQQVLDGWTLPTPTICVLSKAIIILILDGFIRESSPKKLRAKCTILLT